MLTFHDETLECVAKWTITRTAPGATMPEALAIASSAQRRSALIGRPRQRVVPTGWEPDAELT